MDSLPAEIGEALDRGATVVTGNQRAARTLRRAFDRRNQKLGHATWRPADAVAWDTWAARLWRRMLIDGHASLLLLNQTQEHAIWRQILEADRELRSLRSADSLAEMAADAWQRLCRFNGQDKLRGAAASSDARAFQRWAIEFQRRCRDGDFLAGAELEGALRSATMNRQLRMDTAEVVLLGFDRMTPAQGALVEAVRSAGCKVDELRLTMPVESRLLVCAKDETQEIFAAAQWARRLIEERPNARVAIILPALEKRRAEIDRVFRDVLARELHDITASDDAVPYEFSLGVPLARTQMVSAALKLLHWATAALPIEQLSSLLLSPSFAMQAEERGARAEFDAFELRSAQRLRPEISLDWLSERVDRSRLRQKLGRLPAVLRAMRLTAATRLNGSDRRPHAEWAGRIREMLQAAGWGTAAENGVEFQARNKWEDALDEMATLDFDGARVRYERAVEVLERIARQTMFAPESREAPVQVMGAFEAAGATFDAVWFLGSGDLDWPIAASGNPLLPWQLQRDLGMPGTEVARDSEDARQTTARIAASASAAVFSYAVESTGGMQQPSPALKGLHLEEADAARLAGAELERSIVALEAVEDSDPVQTLPDRVIRGGSQILKLQAACGFRAFAEQRLWSTEIDPEELGMDVRQSGTAVHRVLELFWKEVKTQEALKAMPRAERESLLGHCIAQSLEKIAALNETPWDAAYIQMQRDRLHRLIGPWLELEMRRQPFEVKLSEKDFNDVPVGPLRLRVRVDRVDLVEGGEVLIDYKTGAASTNAWLSQRPDEPQLPLYATLAGPEQLQGVAFGLVRAGDNLDLTGYGASKGILPHQRKLEASSLEEQVDSWRHVLVNLATAFHEADATVAPKKYPTTCERCAQRILCRLDVSRLEENDTAETLHG